MKVRPKPGTISPVNGVIHARCGKDVRDCTCESPLPAHCTCPQEKIRPAWQEGIRLCLSCGRRL